MNKSAILSFTLLMIVVCLSMAHGPVIAYLTPGHKIAAFGNIVESTKIRKHIAVYRGEFTEAADFIASHFGMVITGFEVTSTIDRIKTLNPNIIVLGYRDIMGMASYFGDWEEVNLHEDWFLHDIHGNRLIHKYYGWYAMDVGNTGWRSHYANCVKDKIGNSLFDGVFADDVWDTFFAGSGSNPWTVPIEDVPVEIKNRWHSDMLEMIKFVKESIGEKLLIINTSNNGDYVDVCDGKMEEEFVHPFWYALDEFNDYFVNWKRKVDSLKSISQSGKYYLAQSGTIIPENPTRADLDKVHDMMVYCLSSYLLGCSFSGGNATFGFSNEYSVDAYVYCAEFEVSLGFPVNNYYQFDSVYSREFQKGKVLVNPTTSSYTVDLESEYKTLDGQIVSRVTLDAHSGIILLTP